MSIWLQNRCHLQRAIVNSASFVVSTCLFSNSLDFIIVLRLWHWWFFSKILSCFLIDVEITLKLGILVQITLWLNFYLLDWRVHLKILRIVSLNFSVNTLWFIFLNPHIPLLYIYILLIKLWCLHLRITSSLNSFIWSILHPIVIWPCIDHRFLIQGSIWAFLVVTLCNESVNRWSSTHIV